MNAEDATENTLISRTVRSKSQRANKFLCFLAVSDVFTHCKPADFGYVYVLQQSTSKYKSYSKVSHADIIHARQSVDVANSRVHVLKGRISVLDKI